MTEKEGERKGKRKGKNIRGEKERLRKKLLAAGSVPYMPTPPRARPTQSHEP